MCAIIGRGGGSVRVSKPGWYPGRSAGSYHGWQAANKSKIAPYLKSSLQGRYFETVKRKRTSSMAFGTAAHTIALEHSQWEKLYVRAPDINRRTKAGKEEFAAFQDANRGRRVIESGEWEDLLGIHRALLEHPIGSQLLTNKGRAEVSYVWESEWAGSVGTLCKARADRITRLDGDPVMVDLKTTRDGGALPEEFARHIPRFDYDMQGAFYLEGLRHFRPSPHRFLFLVVEKTPPYEISVCELDEGSLAEGQYKAERAMAIYCEAHRTGVFTGYEAKIHQIQTPLWGRTKPRGPDDF